MPHTDSVIPASITRVTTQLDAALYKKILVLAAHITEKNYVLLNKMLLVGAKQVYEDYKERFKGKEVSFNTPDLKELKDFLKEKGF